MIIGQENHTGTYNLLSHLSPNVPVRQIHVKLRCPSTSTHVAPLLQRLLAHSSTEKEIVFHNRAENVT